MADWVLGKWPRALTARRYLALRDSIALVEQMTFQDSGVVVQEGDELAPGVSPQPDHRGVLLSPRLVQGVQRGQGRLLAAGGVDRAQVARERVLRPCGRRTGTSCGSGG